MPFGVGSLLRDAPVTCDRVSPELNVNIGEDVDVLRADCIPESQRLRGFAVEESFVRYVGVGPLVHANPFSTDCLGNCNCLNGPVGDTGHAERHIDSVPDLQGCRRQRCDSLRADVVWSKEWLIAGILHDDRVDAATCQGERILHAGGVNFSNVLSVVGGCPGKWVQVDDTHDGLGDRECCHE